jgi:hypothetical protein
MISDTISHYNEDMHQPATIAARAGFHLSQLERGERDSETGNGKIYQRITGCAPATAELVELAHTDNDGDQMFPDDWKYEFVVESLDLLTECADDVPSWDAFADLQERIESDIYNSDLQKWLSSHSYRAAYCDQAAAELGYDNENEPDINARIGRGQWYEKTQVFDTVAAFIRDEVKAA